MSAYTIRRIAEPSSWKTNRSKYLQLVTDLDRTIFPSDTPCNPRGKYWWLAFHHKEPVGFMCIQRVSGSTITLHRYGVLDRHVHHGLGSRFLRLAERFARSVGAKSIITYTAHYNVASMNTFIKKGYKTYIPKMIYVDDGTDDVHVVYWIKRLKSRSGINPVDS